MNLWYYRDFSITRVYQTIYIVLLFNHPVLIEGQNIIKNRRIVVNLQTAIRVYLVQQMITVKAVAHEIHVEDEYLRK